MILNIDDPFKDPCQLIPVVDNTEFSPVNIFATFPSENFSVKGPVMHRETTGSF